MRRSFQHLIGGTAIFLLGALNFSLWIAGCGDTFNTPVKREYTKDAVAIQWVEVDSDDALRKACLRSGEDKQILACAYPDAVPCRIVTHRNPTIDILGHEMLHCFAGRWHPQG